MNPVGQDEGQRSLVDRPISVSAAFEGSEEIAHARDLARSFLTDVQAVHGFPVSARAMGMVQLVVSEMVTNARKYAPGPCLLTLEIRPVHPVRGPLVLLVRRHADRRPPRHRHRPPGPARRSVGLRRLRLRQRRVTYANYLDDARHIEAVSARSNRQRADQDPATWLVPDNPAERCHYLANWTAVRLQ